MAIRSTRPSDLPVIQRIELAAGELFRGLGMPDIADHPLPTVEILTSYHRAGHAWVAALMAEEATHGLDPAHRIAMIRPIRHPRRGST
jgi:hypothetical protein